MTGQVRCVYRDPCGPPAIGTIIGHSHGGIHCCQCDANRWAQSPEGVVFALRLDDGRAVWSAPHLVRRLTINRKDAA